MPVRRFNFTGRQSIKWQDAQITLYEQDRTAPAQFDADLDLTSYELEGNAGVYVEAYRQSVLMRFPYGTVDRVLPPSDRLLTGFDSANDVLFRVKVTSVETPQGLLLAEASGIRPRRPDQIEESRMPLLPVRPDPDLERQIYRLEFSDHTTLLINPNVGNWPELARQPGFIALVYPAVLREILTRILVADQFKELDDPGNWQSQWLNYAMRLPGVIEIPDDIEDKDACYDWVEEAVQSFCRRFDLLQIFNEYMEGEGSR